MVEDCEAVRGPIGLVDALATPGPKPLVGLLLCPSSPAIGPLVELGLLGRATRLALDNISPLECLAFELLLGEEGCAMNVGIPCVGVALVGLHEILDEPPALALKLARCATCLSLFALPDPDAVGESGLESVDVERTCNGCSTGSTGNLKLAPSAVHGPSVFRYDRSRSSGELACAEVEDVWGWGADKADAIVPFAPGADKAASWLPSASRAVSASASASASSSTCTSPPSSSGGRTGIA